MRRIVEQRAEKQITEFQNAFGDVKKATNIIKYGYKMRKPARRVDIIPNIKNDLMSTGKYVNARYVRFVDKDEVNIYDMNYTTITVLHGSMLRG